MRWTSIVAFLMLVLLQQQQRADAKARLCANADNDILGLYIDGKDVTESLPYRHSVKHCGCMDLPANTGVIAIEAKNDKAAANIQACSTGDQVHKRDWVCKPADKVHVASWYKREFDAKFWHPAQEVPCQEHCRQYYQASCISKSKCFWAHKNADRVYCRLELCAENCDGCKTVNPGECDPGKCKMGSGVSSVTGKTSCNRVCRLEIKAWGKNGEKADGYIKVVDTKTKYADEWKANDAGSYMSMVDMSSCSVINRTYADWDHAPDIGTLYSRWNAIVQGVNNKNVIVVRVAVGPSAQTGPPFGSYAPMIEVGRLAVGDGDPSLVHDHYTSVSAVLTGVQNDVVTVTDIKTTM